MGTEYRFEHTLQESGGNEGMLCQRVEKKFRPRRAKWACYACHKRKVRCDALNQGTSCTNCRHNMKECVPPPQRRKRTTAPTPYTPGEVRADKTPRSPQSPHVSQHPTIPDTKCNDVQSNTADASPRKRKSEPQSLAFPCTSLQKGRAGEGSLHSVDNEVGLWMEMLPPNPSEQLELRSTKDISSPHRDTIDGLNPEQFHHRCSEKLLQAVDILTEVILMHNSLSTHTESSVLTTHPAAETHSVAENQVEGDAPNKENVEYSSVFHQLGENIWDTENTLDGISVLTPESLEFVAASNYNIWLELNDFDLEAPSSLGSYDAE
ncbi:hypothetical protein N7537_009772 [Penicillium hordei]|uniref:Zn(2)-C6 fungal-type domain-containing protein n=1 Tax=Penicillium hordei TaxID=40994 RepID=A0AAD6DTG9_9EURO|nr:uncharacterized protein N7537_009772 [Penicillium hordei]KAJ5592868.1 hypothetical protein N7537_009772 [Penicillium hordei]